KIGGLWPLNLGGRLRSYHLLSKLSERHRVTVVTTHDPGEDPKELAARLPNCERVISLPYAAPKVAGKNFVKALARSWASRLPVDLMKWRVPKLQAEVEWILGT